MAKKKWFAVGVVLLCVALASYLVMLYSPRPIIDGSFSFAYDIEREENELGISTSYRFHDGDFVIVTRVLFDNENVIEKFDHNALVELLSATMSRRSFHIRESYVYMDVLWEISLLHRGISKHILLSRYYATQELNYWYSPNNRRIYRLLDPVAFSSALELMLFE